jgi:cytosine/adenosine deaminase-related metal-dependent hydrolase
VLRIRAGWIHPVTAPPIEDGAVLVNDAGRIAAIGPHDTVRTPRGATLLQFPGAVLVPGLVNCHTHLELTHLGRDGGRVRHDEPDFAKWIRRVRELKDATSAEAFYAAATEGVRSGWSHGITCIAETGSTGAAARALHDLGGRGIVYQEVFGPDPAQLTTSMSDLQSAVARLRRLASPQLRVGISPHAPYTVSAQLYDAVGAFARQEQLPIAVHVAESKEEVALVWDGEGPFADALRARGVQVEPRRCSPLAYLLQHGVIRSGTLCIHCVQVNGADIELLRVSRAHVAHCPRSNAAHFHGIMPLREMRAAAIPIGLGTDSVVSVDDLHLWAEARAALLHGAAALKTLTIDGARALSWQDEIGSLEPGKAADFAVFPALGAPRAFLTVVSGRIVHQISAP